MTDFVGTSGEDFFTGGSESDNAQGNGGNDTLSGAAGSDILSGGAGADTLDGGSEGDTLYSGTVSPPFNAPYSNNPYTVPVLDTGIEVDTLRGGAGDDRIFAGYGDNIDGGLNDYSGDYLFISFQGAQSGVTFNQQTQVIGGGTITGIEHISWVQGSEYDDDITPFDLTYYADFAAVFGMGGNDRLTATYYTGSLFGGDGNDFVDGRNSQYLNTVDGGAGDDTLYTNSNTFAIAYGGDGNDAIYGHGTIYGGAGNDAIYIQQSYYGGFVYGEDGNDTIVASFNGAVISGGNGADTLTGNSGNDTLVSGLFVVNTSNAMPDVGAERDTLTGAGGDDKLSIGYGDNADGGTGTDQLSLSLGGAPSGVSFDTTALSLGGTVTLGGGTIQNIEQLNSLTGTAFADILSIATQGTRLIVDAGDGDDTVQSNLSSITLNGGSGNDRFITGRAADIFDGGAGIDTVDYQLATSAVTVSLGLVAGTTGAGGGGDSLVNVENIDGSNFDDTLEGSNDANTISGRNGNDTIRGFGGDDILIGGAGADLMIGGIGDDQYLVDTLDTVTELNGGGNDRVYATASFALSAGSYVETLSTSDAAATVAIDLTGNDLNNLLIGNAGANRLAGGAGDDTLDGGTGAANTLVGGAGNDIYIVRAAGDSITELANEGIDLVQAAVASFVLTANVENLTYTGAGNFVGIGNASDNIITGGAGADSLGGGAGNDTLIGGAGAANELVGGTGNDIYVIANAGDSIVEAAGEGTDTEQTALGVLVLAANVENLTFTGTGGFIGIGNGGDNVVTGGTALDSLAGRDGNDTLVGGAGAANELVGGLGDDVYVVSAIGDSLVEYAGEGTDTAQTALGNFTMPTNVENLTYTGTGSFAGVGNGLANIITGGTGFDSLAGGAGDDTLIGGTGAANELVGGTGNDTYIVGTVGDTIVEVAGGGGADLVRTALSVFTLTAEVENLIYSGGGNFVGIGNAGANALIGGAGNDILAGKAENDFLAGGAGSDIFVFDTALSGTANVDTITDFVSGTDQIQLARAIFTGLAAGAFDASQFGLGTAATTAAQRIIYDAATSNVYYDADGSGAGAAILFATLSNHPATLSAGDFFVG